MMQTACRRIMAKPVVHNYVPIRFTEVEKVRGPERYLDLAKTTLDGLGLKWCLAFGSALGAYRDNGFVPRDTDVDVMILADEVDTPMLLTAFPTLNLIRTVAQGCQHHQIAFQGDDGFIVDLCCFYRDGDHYVSFCEGGHWKDAVDVIGDFTQVETKYGALPVPEKIEDYLVARYGANWRIPRYGENACSIKEI